MKNKILSILSAVALLTTGKLEAQSANPLDAALNFGGAVLSGPWIAGSGYGRGIDTGNNLVYAYVGYNFIVATNGIGFNAGLLGGYDDLWKGPKSEVNSLSGGFNISESFKPLQLIGASFGTNIVATLAGYQLVCTPRDSTAPIGSVTGTSLTLELFQWKGFHLKAQGEYEVRAGQGQWNDKYICGGLAIGHNF